MKKDDRQLQLPLHAAPKLRVINGLGQKQEEPLADRDAVARVQISAAHERGHIDGLVAALKRL